MKKILLIEDNLEMRENTSEILSLSNFDVVTAKDGREGIELAKRVKPDLILCDIMMPEIDGYGVLNVLGKDPETAGIPFIFLTAKTERKDIRKGMELGADDYLVKPFEKKELLNAIETRLKRSTVFKKNYTRDLNGLIHFVEAANNFSLPATVATEYKVRTYQPRDTIYFEDSEPNFIFLVTKGKVKTWRMSQDGKDFITGLYAPGDFLGYLPILEAANYRDSATAMEETDLALMPKHDFLSLIYSKQEVSAAFMKLLVNNIHENETQLLNLAYNSVRSRVADALLRLHQKFPTGDVINFSREDLAKIVGTSTESLIRALSDLKQEKIIDIKGRGVTILNQLGLESIKKFSVNRT